MRTAVYRQAVTEVRRYPNLHEVRLIPTKRDIAFVEYFDAGSATAAKDGPSLSPFRKRLALTTFLDYIRTEVGYAGVSFT